jgi:hypothetical protein
MRIILLLPCKDRVGRCFFYFPSSIFHYGQWVAPSNSFEGVTRLSIPLPGMPPQTGDHEGLPYILLSPHYPLLATCFFLEPLPSRILESLFFLTQYLVQLIRFSMLLNCDLRFFYPSTSLAFFLISLPIKRANTSGQKETVR